MRLSFLYGISTISLIACQTDKTIQTVNSAPTSLITTPEDGEAVLEGYTFELRGQVSDTNHSFDEIETAWFYGENEICTWTAPDAGGGTFCTIIPNLNDDSIRLEVRDLDGAGGVDTISIIVQATENPFAEIRSPLAGSSYYADHLITFEGTVSDAEDNAEDLSIRWTSSQDGELNIPANPDGDGEFAGAAYLTEGDHFIELIVTDQTGKTDSDNITISVGPPNSSPTCSIEEPAFGSAGAEGDLVLFQGMANDVDIAEDDLNIEWFSDKDGFLGNTTATSVGEVLFPYSSLSVDTHNITMVVTDELGESCTAATLYTVGTPPSILINNPQNGDIFTAGSTILFDITISDAQDQPNEVSLDWNLDGQPYSGLSATSSGTAQISDSGLTYGSHILTILATDTAGLTDQAQISFTVNGRPSQPVISISPSSPSTTDNLAVNIDSPSIDPEGQTPTYSYLWFRNGVLESGATSATIASSSTHKNEIWSVQVTPSDGLTTGNFGEASVTIINTAPSLSGLAISPSGNIYNDDILTCSVTVTDPDETLTPTYEWSVKGQSYFGASLDLSSTAASPNDTLSCTATVTDSSSIFAFDTLSISIDNRPPSFGSVSVSPGILYSNSTASCSYSVTDGDGDPLNPIITWHNGNNPIGSGVSIDLTGKVTNNDPVYCEVSVNDGSGELSLASSAVYITNTAPSAPTIVLRSTNDPELPIAEEDNLICEVNPLPTDIDGGPLYYTFDWTDPNGILIGGGGTPTTDSSDILYANTPTTEGSWTCSVSVSDGALSGGSVSETITVETGCPTNGNGETEECPAIDCSQIYHDGLSTGNGIYWIDLNGAQTPFQVYCDMTTNNEGWTQVGYEIAGDAETFAYLGIETGSANTLATRTNSGLIGARFTDYFDEVWIEWDTESIFFTPSKNIFENSQERTIPLFNFSTTDSTLDGWVSNAGGAHFCRASVYSNITGGDTSWAVKPIDDVHVECGCNSGAWTGRGAYYSGSSNPTLCGANPGGFTGVKDNSQVKGHAVNYNTAIYVFRDYSDGDGDGVAAWEDCNDADPLVSSDCIPADCHERTYNSNGLDYWFCTDHVNWFTAQGICALNGGNLVTVNDASENAWLISTGESIYTFANGARWWLGFHDNHQENSFEWISRQSISYTNWHSGEPNNNYGQSNENCSVLFWNSSTSGWNDMPCAEASAPQSYICKF